MSAQALPTGPALPGPVGSVAVIRAWGGRFWAVAQRDKIGLAATVVGLLIVVVAVAAPLISPYDPTLVVGPARHAPSTAHLLGTDELGRDVLSRTIYGARSTLLIAVLATLLAAVIGVPFGILAGYLTRWSSGLIMRVMDVLLAFPGLLLALVVVTVLGPGVTTVVLAVGISYVPIFARVVYGSTRSIRGQEYIAAARVVGCTPLRIMRRHVFPVLTSELLVMLSSAIGWTALLAATLNFLGFGVRPPAADWGADLAAGDQYLAQAWWISVAPGLALTIMILASNYIGDFLASVADPDRLRRPRARIMDTATMVTGTSGEEA